MKFDITSKLMVNEDPVMVIGDVELTVKSDAKTVLQVMGVMDDGFSVTKMEQAKKLLFSDEDIEKLDNFKMFNWKEIIGFAAQLAIQGELEDDDPNTETPVIPVTPTTT